MLKVFWFRRSALLTRWQEEEAILTEEMQRTVRYFKYKKDRWEEKANEEEMKGVWGISGYSRTQARVWKRLLERAIREFGGLTSFADEITETIFQ